MIKQALESDRILQFEGSSFIDGERQLVISYSLADGPRTLLYIKDSSHLLTKAEFPATNTPFQAAFVPFISFSNYLARSGRRFPSKIVASRPFYGLEIVTDVLDIIAYLPEERILYVTDPFTNDWGRLRRPTAEERAMMKTIVQLKLNPRTILSGHGPMVSFDNVKALFMRGHELK